MRTWERLRRGLLLPLRFPVLLVLSVGHSGLLYAAGMQAGFLDVGNPHWVLSVGGLLLLSPMYHALLIPAIASALRGQRADWRATLRGSQDRFPRLFLGQVLVGAAVVAGSVLLLIPGIYFGMRLIYYKQSIIFERRSVILAFRESLRMTLDWRSTASLFFRLAALYGCAVGLDLLFVIQPPSLAVHVGAVVGTALLLVWVNALVTFAYVSQAGEG